MSKSPRRTAYRDRLPPNNMRSGPATRAEVGLDLENYYQPLLEALASDRGPGIVSGLKVAGTVGSQGLVVMPGIAIDGQGRLIVLAEGGHAEVGPNADADGATPQLALASADGVRIATAGISGHKWLVVRWWETFDEAGFADSGAQRMEHTPWLQLVDASSFVEDQMRIVLSGVQFDTGAIIGLVPYRRTLVKINKGIEFRGQLRHDDPLKGQDAVVARLEAQPESGGLKLSLPTGSEHDAELTFQPDGEIVRVIGGVWNKLSIDSSIVTNALVFSSREPDGGLVSILPRRGAVRLVGPGPASQSYLTLSPGAIRMDNGPELVIEAPAPGGVRINADLIVEGRATFRGPKVGFVVDAFHNATDRRLELGDVVVLAAEGAVSLESAIPIPDVEMAMEAYDTRLCGIVSDAADAGARGHMVTVGCWAHCKVDANISSIRVGDLLTTSGTPGHAQKVLDRVQAIGAILGKALAPLPSGRGTIPVLVSSH